MPRDPASPPCYAHESSAPEIAPPGAAPQDVVAWRKAQRRALIAARQRTPADERARVTAALAAGLDTLLTPGPGVTLSLYWPFKGEPDLRDWMATAHRKGAQIALPLVESKGLPLRFRAWHPGCAMERGVWNIPQPAGNDPVTPDIVIAPLVGFDPQGYRLGYGGGFFDRTLAALGPGVQAIGVGFPEAALPSIHPQWHDIPMQAIVAGERVWQRTGGRG